MKEYGTEARSNHKLKFAAIDIGTNAARLLLTHVYFDRGHPVFKKVGLYRIPLQLGDDVFTLGRISDKKAEKLHHTMAAFSHLIKIFTPLAVIACATSAIREAENGQELADKISAETGIHIQVIDGKTESEMICQNHLFTTFPDSANYLYIDVGGGSTEISHFVRQISTHSHSFKIGTLRLINNWVEPDEWDQMKAFIKTAVDTKAKTFSIGTGGNISKALSLTGEKNTLKPVPLEKLEKLFVDLKNLSVKDRIIKLNLKPDRAEVIVPALDVYIKAMKWAKIKAIYIPKIGLSDGLIQHLFHEHITTHAIPFETV